MPYRTGNVASSLSTLLTTEFLTILCRRLLHYRLTQYSFKQHTVLKSIDVQANFVILFVYY